MSKEMKRPAPIHLKEEELLKKLPEKIGNVTLDYQYYPGEDLYSDGVIEDEILAIVKNASRVEYSAIIEEKKSWPILYHLSPLRGNIVDWLPIKPVVNLKIFVFKACHSKGKQIFTALQIYFLCKGNLLSASGFYRF